MNRIFKLTVLMAGLSTGLASAGEYGGEFLNLPVGPRAIAMGGAFGPLADDASAIYWNPAGLGKLRKTEIMFMHAALFGNLASHDYLAVAWPAGQKFTIGAGWIRLGIDGIPRFSYTVGTPPEGIFGDNENAFLLSLGGVLEKNIFNKPWKIHPGGSLKYIYDKLDDRQATGTGLDLGLIVSINLSDWLIPRAGSQPLKGLLPAALGNSYWGSFSLSLVAQDIGGTSIAWNTMEQHHDVRRAIYKTGLAYQQPINPLRLRTTVSWEGATDDFQNGRLGAEIIYRGMIAFRAGRSRAKPTFGAGLTIWRFNADYAYSSHDLGNTHRVGGSYRLK